MKKLIALVMVVLMLASSLVACNNTPAYENKYVGLSLETIAGYLEFEEAYKNIEIALKDFEKDFDEDLKSAKESLIEQYSEALKEEDKFQKNDKLKITISGFVDGSATADTKHFSSKSLAFTFGVDTEVFYLEELAKELEKQKLGKDFEIEITIPEDYEAHPKETETPEATGTGATATETETATPESTKTPEATKTPTPTPTPTHDDNFAGKKVVFKGKIESASRPPEYDDALIKKAFKDNEDSEFEYDTTKAYEEALALTIKSELAFNALKKQVKVSAPKDLTTFEYDALIENYKYIAENGLVNYGYGYMPLGTPMTIDKYVATYLSSTYKTFEAFKEGMWKQAAATVKNNLLVYFVYNTEKTAIDKLMADNEVRYLFSTLGTSDKEEIKEAGYSEEQLNAILIEIATREFLGEQCVLTGESSKPTATPTPTPTPSATPTETKTAE